MMEAAVAEAPQVFNTLNPSAGDCDFSISPGTSKSQLHKARMRLRRMLKS